MVRGKKRVFTLKVREIAESKNINPSKLSRMADVHYNTLLAIWRNPQHDTNLSTLVKIARALNVQVSELYEVTPDE